MSWASQRAESGLGAATMVTSSLLFKRVVRPHTFRVALAGAYEYGHAGEAAAPRMGASGRVCDPRK